MTLPTPFAGPTNYSNFSFLLIIMLSVWRCSSSGVCITEEVHTYILEGGTNCTGCIFVPLTSSLLSVCTTQRSRNNTPPPVGTVWRYLVT